MKIGKLEIDSYVYIPPMAGVTDLAFRKMVRFFDKETLIATEMVSSKALMYNPNQSLMKLSPDEHPVGIQLFGHESEVMAKAAVLAEVQGADFLDINMGCPAPKITKGKDGAALMKEPDLAIEITKAVISSVKIPVTVKMRLGWDECEKNAPNLASRLEQVGVCAFTIHGRTREQGYTGAADWNAISQVKKSVSVPVFGNGDVRSPHDALKLLEVTGCDGVAIARATMGAPWLSMQINQFLKTGSFLPEPENIEKLALALKHLDELIKIKGETVGVREGRRHLINYTKGMPESAQIRAQIGQVNSRYEAKELLSRLKEELLNRMEKNNFVKEAETSKFKLISVK
ncbi:MAG: tRNA dihydrouridine synthase DusB [Candidatus Melainabacteria bacterium]|nr:tRNA dihydrouridine synthase DusB [Candidatus Melainabacteria bacterium]